MSHVTTRKGASTDEKDKRLTDSSPVRDMKKKVAANAEKEKMAAEKQNGGEKPAEKKDKQPEKQDKTPDKRDGKQNADKNLEKTTKGAEKQHGDKPKEKSAEKPVEKKEKAAEKPVERKEKAPEKPADKKEAEKAKEDNNKGEKSTKPDDKQKPKPAEKPPKAERPVQNGNHHNGVTDVTLSANGGNDVTLPTTVSGDSDSEDMVIVIDDQENDELFPELTYDDTSDNEGFESQEFRSATRRSQAKATRTPETPRPASDKQADPAAITTNPEKTEKALDAPKEATKVLKLKDDPSSASERKLRSSDSPKKQTERAADSPRTPSDAKKDEDIVVVEETETSQDGETRKPDTNFSKSRVKVSPYRRSMRLADQTTSSVNATYTGNNTTMEMDITESSYTELPSVSEDLSASADLNGSHVSALRSIRGRRSYKPLKELSMRTVTRRPATMPVGEQPARPTGTVVGRKRKPEPDSAPEPAAEGPDAAHAKRLRLLDKLMSPFRRTLPASTPLPARRAAPIVGINTDLPLSAPVAAEPFDAEALKNVPTAAQLPSAAQPPSAGLARDALAAGDEAGKRCIVM